MVVNFPITYFSITPIIVRPWQTSIFLIFRPFFNSEMTHFWPYFRLYLPKILFLQVLDYCKKTIGVIFTVDNVSDVCLITRAKENLFLRPFFHQNLELDDKKTGKNTRFSIVSNWFLYFLAVRHHFWWQWLFGNVVKIPFLADLG